ncbi:MAG: hypothetical protein WCY61_05175 [Sphaerochaeta sp.]
MGKLIDTDTSELFIPKPKKELLVGSDKNIDTDLRVIKKLASSQSRSFIFSKKVLATIRNKMNSEVPVNEEQHFYLGLIESLVTFGNYELFVINTTNSGSISLNAQPFSQGEGGPFGMMIPLSEPALVLKKGKNCC